MRKCRRCRPTYGYSTYNCNVVIFMSIWFVLFFSLFFLFSSSLRTYKCLCVETQYQNIFTFGCVFQGSHKRQSQRQTVWHLKFSISKAMAILRRKRLKNRQLLGTFECSSYFLLSIFETIRFGSNLKTPIVCQMNTNLWFWRTNKTIKKIKTFHSIYDKKSIRCHGGHRISFIKLRAGEQLTDQPTNRPIHINLRIDIFLNPFGTSDIIHFRLSYENVRR